MPWVWPFNILIYLNHLQISSLSKEEIQVLCGLTWHIYTKSSCPYLLHVLRPFPTTVLFCWLLGGQVRGAGNMGSAHSSHSPTLSCCSQLIGHLAFTFMENTRRNRRHCIFKITSLVINWITQGALFTAFRWRQSPEKWPIPNTEQCV